MWVEMTRHDAQCVCDALVLSGILVGFLMKQMKQSTLTKGKSYLDSGSWDLPKED